MNLYVKSGGQIYTLTNIGCVKTCMNHKIKSAYVHIEAVTLVEGKLPKKTFCYLLVKGCSFSEKGALFIEKDNAFDVYGNLEKFSKQLFFQIISL